MIKKKSKIKTRLFGYFMTALAGILYATALKYFILPGKVILTGTEGIATALSYYFEDYTIFIILYAVFQLILLTFAFFKVSKTFALRSAIVVLTVITALMVFPEFTFASPESHDERILLVLFGGILAGAAKAMAFQYRGSTGDEDILAAFFAIRYLRPVGSIAIIAAICSTAFGLGMDYLKNGNFESIINTLMYTTIFIFASAETLNNLYHKFKLIMVTVVSRNHQAIGKAIEETYQHRTYTVQQGIGGRSGESFQMVRTIITKEELPRILDAVKGADANCFYYHQEVEGISNRYYITPIG